MRRSSPKLQVVPDPTPPPSNSELVPGWPDDPSLDPYRSAMHADHGPVLRWLSRRFFDKIEDIDTNLEGVRAAAGKGTLLFVMRSHSLLDFLFLNYYLLKSGLPLPQFANGINSLPFGPLSSWLRNSWTRIRRRLRGAAPLPDPIESGYMSALVARGEPVLLFLKRRRALGIGSAEPKQDLAEVLVKTQRQSSAPVYLVPTTLIWDRHPDHSNRGLLDLLLGDSETPGRIRKAMHFAFNFRHAIIRIGEPVDLRAFLADHGKQQDQRIAKKLRWLLLGYLYRERKVVKGPDVKPRRWLFDRILEEPEVRAAIDRTARTEGRSVAVIEARARKILDKTGADFRFSMILFLKTCIDVIVKRIYSGVEFSEEDAERIRKAARKGTVLLMPSHRSHFDYLLLSWLCYHQGLMPPHIAAGLNLSFFPMGPIFRRGGAFFIRRSFAGDELYHALLTSYMRALIAEGYTQEFFLEGGRSRTGKMLPPKVGLLGIYVQAMADRIVPDIQLVPIYVAYEKVVEEGSYQRELTGGAKKSENAGDLVKGASVLRHRFGKVYVKTNEPISLKDALDSLRPGWHELDHDGRKDFLKRLASHVTAEIQDATVVTPSTVAASVLLTHDRRGMTRGTFHERARFFTRWLEGQDAHFSDAWHFPEDALDEALLMFEGGGRLEILPSNMGDNQQDILAISTDPGQRMTLDSHKNAGLFHFVPGALVCMALAMNREEAVPLSTITRRFEFLRELFTEEFIFHPDVPVEHTVRSALRSLQYAGVIGRRSSAGEAVDHRDTSQGLEPVLWLDSAEAWEQDVEIHVVREERARLVRGMIRNFLEAYYVVLKGIRVLRRSPLIEKDLIEQVMLVSRRMHLTEDVTLPESASKANIRNAIKLFRSRGVLVRLGDPVEDPQSARLALDEAEHERHMRPLRRLFETVG